VDILAVCPMSHSWAAFTTARLTGLFSQSIETEVIE